MITVYENKDLATSQEPPRHLRVKPAKTSRRPATPTKPKPRAKKGGRHERS